MGSALVALATTTLASSSATVTFSSISGAYRDLRLVIQSSSVADTADLVLRFNGDTGSNYNMVQMYGDGGSAYSSSASNAAYLAFGYYNTSQGMNQLNVFDYSATDKHKTTLARADLAGLLTMARAGRWASTAAVTSLLVYPTFGSFAAGSTFSLYGIVS